MPNTKVQRLAAAIDEFEVEDMAKTSPPHRLSVMLQEPASLLRGRLLRRLPPGLVAEDLITVGYVPCLGKSREVLRLDRDHHLASRANGDPVQKPGGDGATEGVEDYQHRATPSLVFVQQLLQRRFALTLTYLDVDMVMVPQVRN